MIPSQQLAAAGSSLTTTTSYQDVPNLSIFISAGGMYRFRAFLRYQGATANTSALVPVMGGSCTATFISYSCRIANNATGGSSSFVHNALAPAGAGAATAVNAATTNYGVVIDGLIVVNNAGTLEVQAKHSGAACTIQSGGRYIVEQVA